MVVRPVPILLYHSVSDDADRAYATWNLPPRQFREHISFLRSSGYDTLTVGDFVRRRPALPEKCVVVTFDDGLADFHSGALPTLAEVGVPATLYVVAGFVGAASAWLKREGEGARRMLTWEQLREVADQGIECGSHSWSHPQLDTLHVNVARDEIVRSKSVLEDGLGRAVTTFAYPHGYHSSALKRIVRESGYSSACGVKHAMSSDDDDAFALARIIVAAGTTVQQLAELLKGKDLRVAPRGERARTKAWRAYRKARARLTAPAP